MIIRAIEAFRSETGVGEVKGAELRRYVEQSATQPQAAAYLNDTRELLTQLRQSGMNALDLERVSAPDPRAAFAQHPPCARAEGRSVEHRPLSPVGAPLPTARASP